MLPDFSKALIDLVTLKVRGLSWGKGTMTHIIFRHTQNHSANYVAPMRQPYSYDQVNADIE